MKKSFCLGFGLFSLLANHCNGQENISKVSFPTYQHAFVRGLSDSFEDSLKLNPPSESINLELAQQQHTNYIHVLKNLLANVIELDADPNHPDSNFIEDTAIIVGEQVVISRMGAVERRGEELPVAQAIADLNIKTITFIQAPATMDGGDILYTGKHLFVGLSRRTNGDALKQLQNIFQDKLEVVGIPVTEGLHLKSILTALDADTLVVAGSEAGKKIQGLISELTHHAYEFVVVPDPVASNVLRINSTLIIQKGYPESEEILQNYCMAKQLKLVTINMSELIKADGALTCGSLLLE
jgi:dimethylargininase